MSNFTPVKPGQLITADYFNQIFGSFDARISALEVGSTSSGAAVITGLSPQVPCRCASRLQFRVETLAFPSVLSKSSLTASRSTPFKQARATSNSCL